MPARATRSKSRKTASTSASKPEVVSIGTWHNNSFGAPHGSWPNATNARRRGIVFQRGRGIGMPRASTSPCVISLFFW